MMVWLFFPPSCIIFISLFLYCKLRSPRKMTAAPGIANPLYLLRGKQTICSYLQTFLLLLSFTHVSKFSALHSNYTVMDLTLAKITKDSNKNFTMWGKVPEMLQLNTIIKAIVFSWLRAVSLSLRFPIHLEGAHSLADYQHCFGKCWMLPVVKSWNISWVFIVWCSHRHKPYCYTLFTSLRDLKKTSMSQQTLEDSIIIQSTGDLLWLNISSLNSIPETSPSPLWASLTRKQPGEMLSFYYLNARTMSCFQWWF